MASRISLPKGARETLVQERETGRLVRSCYRWLESRGRLRAAELVGLTKLTWITVVAGGGEASGYELKTTIPGLRAVFRLPGEYGSREEVADALPTNELRAMARKPVGIVNLFPAFRGSYVKWVRRNEAAVRSICTAATRLRTDEDRVKLARQIDRLPAISRGGGTGGPLPANSALSPLVCCLDPGHRFPIVNNASHVRELLAMSGVYARNTVDRVRAMLGWIGHYGIVDAFYLDAAAMWGALRPLRGVVQREIRKSGRRPGRRTPGRTLSALGWENAEESQFFRRARTVRVRRMHRKMTNALKKLLEGRFKAKRGPHGPGQFDVLVERYEGEGRDLLIEVKSFVDLNAVRLAVGQLLDYHRHLKNRETTDLAVMLPSEPPELIKEFVKDDDVSIKRMMMSASRCCGSPIEHFHAS
jgi:hypothetical protein